MPARLRRELLVGVDRVDRARLLRAAFAQKPPRPAVRICAQLVAGQIRRTTRLPPLYELADLGADTVRVRIAPPIEVRVDIPHVLGAEVRSVGTQRFDIRHEAIDQGPQLLMVGHPPHQESQRRRAYQPLAELAGFHTPRRVQVRHEVIDADAARPLRTPLADLGGRRAISDVDA